jgi:hypothetical protein
MKRISSVAFPSLLTVVAACSSSPSSQTQSSVADAGADGSDQGGDNGGGDDSGGNTTPTYAANLSGYEVVPMVATAGSGKATFALSADGTTLSYNVTLMPGALGPTAVNLHVGAVGENTGTTHQLTPISAHMTGQIALTMEEQAALPLDQLYVDVQTAAHPSGELRGQIVLSGAEIFVAQPTAAQEVPPGSSAYTAHASFIMSPDQGTLIYHVATTATPTDIRLHRGVGGVNGQVAYDLPIGSGLPIDGTLAIGGATANGDPADLQNGRFYVNIITQQSPAGELRGQLVHPGELLFTGILSGANEVPPVGSLATGGAQFIVSADQTSAKYEYVVSGIIPTGAELDRGFPGQPGTTMYGLTLDQSGAMGSLGITSNDVQTLLSVGTYANVKTASNPAGDLRAQLVRQ